MNILDAIHDENLFRSYLGTDLSTWKPWLVALKTLYGLPGPRAKVERQLITQCTGRSPGKLPKDGFDTALFLTGRRSGKSRIAATVAAYESILAGHQSKLAPGEKGVVLVASPTKSQSRVVHDYIKGVFQAPLLRNEVVNETVSSFELKSGIRIEILAGDWRTVRGYSLVCAVIDEVAFFGVDAESKVKSDSELIRAIRPGLASIGGRLVCISSPYARLGWSYTQYERNYGNDNGRVLLWNCPSRTMNSTLPQETVDEALAEDYASAQAEYLGMFRDDIQLFLSRELIDTVVIRDRQELLPRDGIRYHAFVDVSGGRSDGSALAIGHQHDGKIIVDGIYHWQSPHDPHRVVACMAEELRRFRVRHATADAYGAEWTVQSFAAHGIKLEKSKLAKSQLYLELLPLITSRRVELLDHELTIKQLANLERRTRSGGRDSIDHAPNCHDDAANVVAGLSVIASVHRRRVGALKQEDLRWQTCQKIL